MAVVPRITPEGVHTVAVRRAVPDDLNLVGSDDLDGHVASVRGERLDVGLVAGEDRAAGLGHRHHDSVDGGTPAGTPPQLGGAPGEGVGHDRLEDAGLEEPVGVRISAGVTLERLHEYDGGHERRPQLGVDERFDECE